MYVYDRHSEYYLNIIVVLNILFVRKLYYTLIYYNTFRASYTCERQMSYFKLIFIVYMVAKI